MHSTIAAGPAFHPNTEPHCDFLIAARPTERLRAEMTSRGAAVRTQLGCDIYTWGFEADETVFLGIGVADGRFHVGPARLGRKDADIAVGTCCILSLDGHGVTVRPDPQGLYAIYAGDGFATNNLHLAALAAPGLNEVATAAMFYNNSHIIWDQQTTYNTFLEGVRLVPPFSEITVGNGQVSVRQLCDYDYEVIEPELYWSLIENAAAEICANVEAVLDSGYPIMCDITGGQDSRILLGALIALDRVRDVSFRTERTPNQWGEADQIIGSGLVREFGGSYVFDVESSEYRPLALQDAWELRRSQIFGTYHSVRQTLMAPGRTIFAQRFVRVGGSCGEIYRDAFPVMARKFNHAGEVNPEVARRFFEKHMWPGFAAGPFKDAVTAETAETSCALTGGSLQEKLNAHHLSFRSRAHFRDKTSFHKSIVSIGPLFSPSLLKAVRGLPQRERETGRAMFDVTRQLCERLPHFPFAKEFERDYFSSSYHRPSKYDGTVLDLPDGMGLLEEGNRHRAALARQFRPSTGISPEERADFFDVVIAQSLACLRDHPGRFDFLHGPHMARLLEHGCKKGDKKFQRMASKLQQIADLIAICGQGGPSAGARANA